MHGMDVPGGKKPIFSAHLRKNPADTASQEGLSIDITFDPLDFRETLPLNTLILTRKFSLALVSN